jgi:tripartite-type tricarboxylate transporter receptor subunit TctC
VHAACRTFAFGVAATAVALSISFTLPAAAQKYPDRPVKIVLPFGPGGVADVTARLVAEKLGDKLGQRFVIENMPGPGGIVAGRAVLSAPADGYTLLLMTGGIASSVPLYNKFPLDMTKDFVAISSMGYFDCLMVVNAQSEFKTLGDFLKVAREKPGKLNIGTISAGGVQNLTANYFKQASGLDVVIVPFRTTPDAIVALMRNDVEMVIDFYAALKSGLEDNKLRAVAWTGPQPSPALPNVPTALGEGVKGFEAASWNAIYAKAGTPPEVLATLNKAMQEVLAEPDVKKRLLDLGIDSKASTPAEMDAQMRGDITKWTEVIDRAGIEKR